MQEEESGGRWGCRNWEINQWKLCQHPFPGWDDGKTFSYSLGISFVNTRRSPEPEVLERNLDTWSGCFEHFWSEILLCLCCLLHQIKTASWGLSVSMNLGGGGESMISAAYLLSHTAPAKQRLNHFSLIAHVSQKSHLNTWTLSPTGLRPHSATSHYLITPAEKMLQFTKMHSGCQS